MEFGANVSFISDIQVRFLSCVICLTVLPMFLAVLSSHHRPQRQFCLMPLTLEPRGFLAQERARGEEAGEQSKAYIEVSDALFLWRKVDPTKLPSARPRAPQPTGASQVFLQLLINHCRPFT